MQSDEDAPQTEEQELEFLIEQRRNFALAQQSNDVLQHKLRQTIEQGPKALAELQQIEELLDLAEGMYESDITSRRIVRADSPSSASMPMFPGLAASTPELKALQDELLGLKQLLIKSVWTRADDRCLEAAVLNKCRKLAAYKFQRERHPDPLGAVKAMDREALSQLSLPGYMRSDEQNSDSKDDSATGSASHNDPIQWDDIATTLAMTASANAHTAQACRTRWLMVIRPGLNNGPWSEKEQERLFAAVDQMRGGAERIDWEKAAKAVGNGRLPVQCLIVYQRLRSSETDNSHLNNPILGRENLYDEELLRMMSIWGINWPLISERLRRPTHSLQTRFTISLDTSIRRGPWQPEEIRRLYDAVHEQVLAFERANGRIENEPQPDPAATATPTPTQDAAETSSSSAAPSQAEMQALQLKAAKVRLDWPLLAARVRTRSKLQCREKWLERPAQRGQWTAEEDRRLAEAVRNKTEWTWAQVGRAVGNRTGKQARDRWEAIQKNKKGDQGG